MGHPKFKIKAKATRPRFTRKWKHDFATQGKKGIRIQG